MRPWRPSWLGRPCREYAKLPGHAYDARVREQLLDQADRKFGPEIGRGVEWLRTAAVLPAVRAMFDAVAARQTHAP